MRERVREQVRERVRDGGTERDSVRERGWGLACANFVGEKGRFVGNPVSAISFSGSTT